MIDDLLKEVAERSGCQPEDVQWYSWPQVFGNTAGPRGGCGGNALTTFQVFAFSPPIGDRCKYCAGVWRRWDGDFMGRW